MLLQQLRAYGQRDQTGAMPTLYNEAPLRYLVELNADGSLATPRLTDRADASHVTTKRGKRHPLPQVGRASGIKAFLLADKSDYSLGFAGPHAKPERVKQAHAAFVDLLRRCEAATHEPAVGAVVRFLESGQVAALEIPEGFDAGATVSFRIDDEILPVDLPAVRRFWASENDPGQKGAKVMQCLVCGEWKPAVERLQLKIKGIPGGQMAGTSLISANADAFTSYGLSASLIAPTCASCGEEFTKAANELLASEQTCVRTPGTAFVFWAHNVGPTELRRSLMDADPEEVQRLREGVATAGEVTGDPEEVRRLRLGLLTGDRQYGVDPRRFFAVTLTASGGRAVVRNWLDTTVGEVDRNVALWFDRQETIDWNGERGKPLAVWALRNVALSPHPGRGIDPLAERIFASLVVAALTAGPMPASVLDRAVTRIRADRSVDHRKAALLKLYLLSQPHVKEDYITVSLNPDHPDVAYQCGRLLAVLEEAQRAAQPRVTNTIVDRFYGTASATPATIFGRLMRGAQPHLSVLEGNDAKRGAYVAIQKKLGEITSRISAFPTLLNLKQQGLFALGYYHQRAHRNTSKED